VFPPSTQDYLNITNTNKYTLDFVYSSDFNKLTQWSETQRTNYYTNSQVKVYLCVIPGENIIKFWVSGLENYKPTLDSIFTTTNTNYTIDYGFGIKELNKENNYYVHKCDLKQLGNISTGFSKVTEYDMTINKVNIGLKSNTNITLFTNQPIGDLVMVSCLLEGTLIKTPNGLTPIEKIKTGDYVTNQNGVSVRIKRMTKSRNQYNYTSLSNASVFKIASGNMGSTSNLYVSKHHKIKQSDGSFVKAYKLNLPIATKSEICDRLGNYILYNIQLENHKENNLVVNGGCIVESWNGLNDTRTKSITIQKYKQGVSGFLKV
jgi:hypothetical protein